MDWNEYQKFLNQKIADAKYNYESAQRRFKEAKAAFDAAVMEKQAFENALDEKTGEI